MSKAKTVGLQLALISLAGLILADTIFGSGGKTGHVSGTYRSKNTPSKIDLGDVRPGVFLFMVGKDFEDEILVLSAPYMKDGMCRFDSMRWSDDQIYYAPPEDSFCFDLGLAPNRAEVWNKYNHLIPSERLPMPPHQLEDLKMLLRQTGTVILVSPSPIILPNQS